jgi:hypothetical protein
VRDTKTGTVRAVVGESYMLKPSETLWPKVRLAMFRIALDPGCGR